MQHHLKIKQAYLYHILEGRKTFEVRKNDRDFQVGDIITFLPLISDDYNVYEYVDVVPKYEIIYIHHGLGMQEGYVCMSIQRINEENNK